MRNTDVFSIPVFRATSHTLHTGTSFVDCYFKVFICENTLEVRTSENRGTPMEGRTYKLLVSSKRRIKEVSLAGVIGPNPFFLFFSVRNLRKVSVADSRLR